jgi:hypothetical protein
MNETTVQLEIGSALTSEEVCITVVNAIALKDHL